MACVQRSLPLRRLWLMSPSCQKFSNAAPNTNVTSVTFQNILSDENKVRAQQKLQSVAPIRTVKEYPLKAGHNFAAVLVPLCTVNGEPSLLLTLRSNRLKLHRGQVSFPGGNVDETDSDYIHTALRETHEELGIDPISFDVWGQMNPLPGSDGRKLVYPVLARTGEVDVSSLQVNKDEVEEAFTVTLSHLTHSSHVGATRFRDSNCTLPVYMGAAHRIWGLTAVIIHQLLYIIAPGLYTFKIKHQKSVISGQPSKSSKMSS